MSPRPRTRTSGHRPRVFTRAILLVIAISLLACFCPIPLPLSDTIVPHTVVTVVDNDSGEPIAGADIEIYRYIVHYDGGTHLKYKETATTDDDGVAMLEELVETEWRFEVYMHSSTFEWQICVRHDDYRTVDRPDDLILEEEVYDDEFAPWEFTVEMAPGQSIACEDDDDGDEEPTTEGDPEADGEDAADENDITRPNFSVEPLDEDASTSQ